MVGGGDTAVEEAIYLTKYGTRVSLQCGPARLCSIPEASCPRLLCSQAVLVHQGRVDTVRHIWTRVKSIMNSVLIQRCLFEHFV